MKIDLYERLNELEAKGEILAETKWKDSVQGLEPRDASGTALILENAKKWMSSLSETVRAQNVGNFDRYAFPLIRAVYPSLVSQDLVSVQPMDGPVGLVFFFDIVYGTNKGRIQAGTPMFSSQTGHPGDDFYSSPRVEGELVGNGTGAAVAFQHTASFLPVAPGTVHITESGGQEVTDDGNGNLQGDIDPAGPNTINYTSGLINVRLAAAPATGVTVDVDYEYDTEGSTTVPEVDFHLTSAPVIAKVFKLRTIYSLEAAQNLRALHGLNAEVELVTALAEELRFEIDRNIIKDINGFAQADTVTWPINPSTGISYTEHKLSSIDIFIRGSNNIFKLTRRGQPNWIVGGVEVLNVIESLPGFQASDQMKSPNGVVFAGTLNGRWRVYKDPYNIDNTDTQRNFLIGFKGSTFLDAGYVYAPYIPFYTTPTVVLDDFLGRKGMATSFGLRKINGRFYCQGTFSGAFAP
jgi:hypothetical protein